MVGLDRLVPQRQAVFGAFLAKLADVEIADHVAEVVELDRSARRVGQVHRPHRRHQLGLVARVAAERLEARLHHIAIDVEQAGILARNGIEVLQHAVDETLVAVGCEIQRVRDAAGETDRFIAIALEQGVIAAGFAGDDREFQPGAGIGLHEAQRVRAGEALADAVAIGNLRDKRRIVRRDQRRPNLLEDLAAIVFEGLLEAAHLFVTEGEVFGDADDALEFHFLGGVVRHRMHRLRGGCRSADEIRIGAALRHVFGSGEAQQRNLVLRDVVGNRQQFEGRERSEDGVDFVALDQFLNFGLGAGGIAAGVGGEEFDVAAGDLVVVLLQPGLHALFHLDAALRQRTGLDGEQAELEGRCLRDGRRGEFERHRGGAGGGRSHEFTARNLTRHCIPPIVALIGLCCLWPCRPFFVGRLRPYRHHTRKGLPRPPRRPLNPSTHHPPISSTL